ncbi:MAG TPA: hypothetical protein VH723_03235 [Candidatus Limnocylindrales bacterium]
MRRLVRAAASAALALVLTACQPSTPRTSVSFGLETLNDSGVTGTVTLTDAGDGRTRVEVRVDPAGNLDMPAHIHPGSCDALVPQPKLPLENVVNGFSATVVPAPLTELTAGGLAVNLHRSNQDLATYTACADL